MEPLLLSNPQEVISLKEKEDKDSIVWWNPVSDTIVKGSSINERGQEEPNRDPSMIILNLKEHFIAKKEYLTGKRSWENYVVKGYGKEFEDSAYTFNEQIDLSKKRNVNLLNAAVIRPEHFRALQTTAINEMIIAIENRNHILLQTVTTINSDKLNERKLMEIADTGRKVTRNIGEEGLPTDIAPYKWRDYSIGLQLNGTKAVFAGTMNLTAFDFDVMAPFVQIMEGAIQEDKNFMISEILNGAGFTSTPIATDWDLYDANGRPTARAYADIGILRKQIGDNKKGQANWIGSNLSPYEIYVDNSTILGQNATGPINQSSYEDANFIAGNIPRQPGMRWAVDDLFPADSVTVWNQRAIYFNQGPRRSSTITNSITGNFGTINLEYYKAKLMMPELIKRYTAVST